jgi:hypothetical protein
MRRTARQDSTAVTRPGGVAAREASLRQIAWLNIATVAALFAGFSVSWRLWMTERLFPLVPIASWLPKIRFPFDIIWFTLLLALLVVIALRAQARNAILAFVVTAVTLGLWDQMRWQPWFYQEIVMLAAISSCWWGRRHDPINALNGCRLIVVFTYLWSGLQKFNAAFVRETWPDFTANWVRHLPDAIKASPPWLALIVPLIEVVIALGLISTRHRNLAVWLAVTTHSIVLLFLVSSAENIVVWPWNVAMAWWVVILFGKAGQISAVEILVPKDPVRGLLLLLFGVLPLLSFFGLWDSYLSSALYSGNTEQAVILVSPADVSRFPALTPYIWQKTPPFFLDINRWSYGELNVPVYPERRVFRQVAKSVCVSVAGAPDLKLMIKGRPNLLTSHRDLEYYDCEHLDSVR